MKASTLKSELVSYGITYSELAKFCKVTPDAINKWFVRDTINEQRYNLIKKAIRLVLEERYQIAKRNKQSIYG